MNERITEDFVRDHFKKDPLFNVIKLEEQKSTSARINGLLQTSSKSGSGIGKPEFIITFPNGNADNLIVVECKANITSHRSKGLDQPKDFAVDGVLHYAKNLSSEYNVIAVAVSGMTLGEMKVSHFYFKKNEFDYKEIRQERELRSINEYLKLFDDKKFSDALKNVNIIQKSIYLNELYQSYSVTETTRCTIISAILVSLLDDPFRLSYSTYSSSTSLAKAMLSAIENVLTVNNAKSKDAMLGEYSKILNEPLFSQNEIKHKNEKQHKKSIEVNKEIISYIHSNIYPLIDMEQSGFDVLGRFYTEFIRYAGSEQSQGLVLTPAHITELFCDLAKIDSNSIIYDPCCGTGGFLIAGMKKMFDLAGTNQAKRGEIKSKQLVGVEIRPSMFTYACSNMMMRGDGKSNIYCGDCFGLENIIINTHKPNIAFLNPPYDVGNAGQMRFIEHALNVVERRSGTVVAIVQMSCAIKNEKELIAIKNSILEKNRLVAVLSMPDDLFYPVGVVTAIMVFKAGEPNAGKKTWFGYFKNDGFEKRKLKGRIDAKGIWHDIKKRWIEAYNNFDQISGLSVKREVTGEEEWCAEAYMETDYSTISEKDFQTKINKYIAYKILNQIDIPFQKNPVEDIAISLHDRKWKLFQINQLFYVKYGVNLELVNLTQIENGIPFISRTSENNGVSSYVEEVDGVEPNPGNTISVSGGGSVLECFFQEKEYYSGRDLYYLKPKLDFDKYSLIFIATILEKEKYRFNYGRQANKTLPYLQIHLPINKNEEVDIEFINRYIKSLKYSMNI